MPNYNKRVQEAIMIMEKKNTKKEGRILFNGKPTREWLSRKDILSTMASLLFSVVKDNYMSITALTRQEVPLNYFNLMNRFNNVSVVSNSNIRSP